MHFDMQQKLKMQTLGIWNVLCGYAMPNKPVIKRKLVQKLCVKCEIPRFPNFRPSKSNCLSFYDSQWTSWETDGDCHIWQNYTRQCLNIKSKRLVSDYACSSPPPSGSNITVLYSYKREYCHSSMYVVIPELGLDFSKAGWVS